MISRFTEITKYLVVLLLFFMSLNLLPVQGSFDDSDNISQVMKKSFLGSPFDLEELPANSLYLFIPSHPEFKIKSYSGMDFRREFEDFYPPEVSNNFLLLVKDQEGKFGLRVHQGMFGRNFSSRDAQFIIDSLTAEMNSQKIIAPDLKTGIRKLLLQRTLDAIGNSLTVEDIKYYYSGSGVFTTRKTGDADYLELIRHRLKLGGHEIKSWYSCKVNTGFFDYMAVFKYDQNRQYQGSELYGPRTRIPGLRNELYRRVSRMMGEYQDISFRLASGLWMEEGLEL